MARDQLSSTWQQLEQTAYLNATVRLGMVKLSSRIRLISHDSNGRVAEVEMPCNSQLMASTSDDDSEDVMFGDGDINDRHKRPESAIISGDSDDTFTPTTGLLRYSLKNPGSVEAIITWPSVAHETEVEYEIEWVNSDPLSEVTGLLYTSNNLASLLLWPNHIYQVRINALVHGARRRILKRSELLLVNTIDSKIVGENPLEQICSDCLSVQQFAIFAGLALLLVIAVVVFVNSRDGKHSDDLEKGTARSSSIGKRGEGVDHASEKVSSVKSHQSLKKQLSSMGARISQVPLTPGGQHSRLIEEDPPVFSFENQQQQQQLQKSDNLKTVVIT